MLLAQAEQMMLDDAYIIPLYVGVNLNLVSPRVTGWVDNAVDIHPVKYLCPKAADTPATANREPSGVP